MIADSFENFFLTMAATGGALIGLLFVAISIHPQRTFDPPMGAGLQDQRLAEATLLTLANGFVVSSLALIPGISVGWVALVLGAGGLLTAALVIRCVAVLHRHGAPSAASWRHRLHVVLLELVATGLYAVQCLLGLHLLLQPADASPLRWLALTIIGLYLVGIAHTWTLLGNPQHGWSGWLNPLQDLVATGEMTKPQQASVPRPGLTQAVTEQTLACRVEGDEGRNDKHREPGCPGERTFSMDGTIRLRQEEHSPCAPCTPTPRAIPRNWSTLSERTLVPGDGARLAETRLEDCLTIPPPL